MRRDYAIPMRTTIALASMLALAGCVLETGGQGSSSANVGQDDDSTSVGGTTLVETSTSSTSVDPSLGTGFDETAAETSSTTEDPTTSDGSGSDTGITCMPECLAGWECTPGGCVNPDEDEPCTTSADCGPAAPFCGPDGRCHDGTDGDPCYDDAQCPLTQACGLTLVCQDGSETDPCSGASDCGPTAPICSNDAQCHDGTDGDSCGATDQCAPSFVCGPVAACQDGNEDDPCSVDAHCGGAAPYCAYDGMCHDGSAGDPCNDDTQCMGGLLGCVNVFGAVICTV